MDTIFGKCKGWFDVVRVAKEEPHMYGANGERLVGLDEARPVDEEKKARNADAQHMEDSKVTR